MGALPPGAYEPRRGVRSRAGFHVLTIFVNPTQFAPTEDHRRSTRGRSSKTSSCAGRRGSMSSTCPTIAALYPEGYDTWVTVDGMSKVLEGEFRPTHFRGVTTIVLKLFNHCAARRCLLRRQGLPAADGHPQDGPRPERPGRSRRLPDDP